MVKYLFVILLFVIGCKKDNTQPSYIAPPQATHQPTSVTGNAKFYYLAEPFLNIGSGVAIYIDGIYKGKITSAPESVPQCNNIWGFNYSDTAKVYNYIAKVVDAFPATHNFIKYGTFEIVVNGCTKINTRP